MRLSTSIWDVITESWGLATILTYFTVWRLEFQGEGIAESVSGENVFLSSQAEGSRAL